MLCSDADEAKDKRRRRHHRAASTASTLLAAPVVHDQACPPRIAAISCCNRTGNTLATVERKACLVAPVIISVGMNSPDFCLTIGTRPEPVRAKTCPPRFNPTRRGNRPPLMNVPAKTRRAFHGAADTPARVSRALKYLSDTLPPRYLREYVIPAGCFLTARAIT
jgi:hypothetical protein